MNTDALTFKVRGLDCAEEVATIKSALSGLGYADDDLGFDLIQGKLHVSPRGDENEENAIASAVSKTGLNTIPWQQHIANEDGGEGFWSEYGRMTTCALSGVAVVAAFFIHGFAHGWSDALGWHDDPHHYPPLSLAGYVLAIAVGYWFVAPKALSALRRKKADMNVLMVAAVCGAMLLGEWMEAAVVAFLFAVSLQLEAWSVGRARRSIGALLETAPDTARVYCCHDKQFEEKPTAEVNVGARVQIRPGDKVPLDGHVTSGNSYVNQAPITGESKLVEVEVGSDVFAGSLNGDGTLEIEVTKSAEHSTLSRMVQLIEDAHSRRSERETWVEQFAATYTPSVMLLSLLVMLIWPIITGDAWSSGIYQGLVLLVIACPCALVISTPVSIVSALTSAARHGVLMKGGATIDRAASIAVIATDKTGTLTTGTPRVETAKAYHGHTVEEVMERAAALESQSSHPIAEAILAEARAKNIPIPECSEYQIIQGKGAVGILDGREFWVGSPRLLQDRGMSDFDVEQDIARFEERGGTVIVVGNQQHVCGIIDIADSIRDDAAVFVRSVHDAGVDTVVMLTGDAEGPARRVAEVTGLDDVRFGLLPEEKVEAIAEIDRQGRCIAMLGDGVNDAPAMAASTLGIAMGSIGSDAAIETADVALLTEDLTRVPWMIGHAKRTLRIIRQNIFFALGTKLAFVVLALAGISTLWMAIMADMGTSLLVIANAMRLLR